MAADIRGIAGKLYATNSELATRLLPSRNDPVACHFGEAYRVTALLNQKHKQRGEKRLDGRSELIKITAQVGRRCGGISRFRVAFFIIITSSCMRSETSASAPLAGFSEPRIEPEIIYHARSTEIDEERKRREPLMDLKWFSQFPHNRNYSACPLVFSQRTAACTAHC